jgi:hypothetical protein
MKMPTTKVLNQNRGMMGILTLVHLVFTTLLRQWNLVWNPVWNLMWWNLLWSLVLNPLWSLVLNLMWSLVLNPMWNRFPLKSLLHQVLQQGCLLCQLLPMLKVGSGKARN